MSVCTDWADFHKFISEYKSFEFRKFYHEWILYNAFLSKSFLLALPNWFLLKSGFFINWNFINTATNKHNYLCVLKRLLTKEVRTDKRRNDPIFFWYKIRLKLNSIYIAMYNNRSLIVSFLTFLILSPTDKTNFVFTLATSSRNFSSLFNYRTLINIGKLELMNFPNLPSSSYNF